MPIIHRVLLVLRTSGLVFAMLALAAPGLAVARVSGAASPSLSASATLAPGITLSAQVRNGPYFASEALIVQFALRNGTKRAVGVTQPGLCAFSAQVVVPNKPSASGPLPPPPSCASPSVHTSLAPGKEVTGSALAVVPLVRGARGQQYTVRLQASAQLQIDGVRATNPTLASGLVNVPAVGKSAIGGGRPEQTLQIFLERNAQGFTVRVGDARGRPVANASGWYVVHAPDGDLAWGTVTAGQTYFDPSVTGSVTPGVYKFTVVMASDGYAVATSSITFRQ